MFEPLKPQHQASFGLETKSCPFRLDMWTSMKSVTVFETLTATSERDNKRVKMCMLTCMY